MKTPEAILFKLKENNSLTLIEIAKQIGKSTHAVERAAKMLESRGKLKHIDRLKCWHSCVQTNGPIVR